MPNPSHTGLLITHLERILFNKTHFPDRVGASIAELRAVPTASQAANELAALLGVIVAETPISEVIPLVPVIGEPDPATPTPTQELMFFKSSFCSLSAKLDQILAAIKTPVSKPVSDKTDSSVPSKDGGEVTSPAMCKLAAQVVGNNSSSKLNKKLAGALLTQCPDNP